MPDVSRIKVLQIFGILDAGGAETRTLEMIPLLKEQGFDIDFVTLTGRKGYLAPNFEELGCRVIPMRLGPSFPLIFTRFMRQQRYEVIHSHVATASGALLFLSRAASVSRRIAHFRSDGDAHASTTRRNVQRWIGRLLIRLNATDILGVSPGSLSAGYREDWASDPRCRVIPNGLPALSFPRGRYTPSPDLRLVNVGRPLPTKRRAFVAEVAHHLALDGRSVNVTYVGPAGDDITPYTESAGGSLPVSFHGTGVIADVRGVLQSQDVLVFPSTREGLPGTVLEALSVGLPVVATDIPGTRYIAQLLPGVHLLPGEAAPEAWARTVVQASLASDERRAEIASAFAAGPFTTARASQELGGVYARASR
ncbi:glycosyltransferase [Kytococcus sedentarius]|uniref:glycosyltransferase n=1 Tax=Kytococcus sedentarius TaxID=1276 RepID=UPI00384F4855